MRIKVQITLESGEGESETLEVVRLERGNLRPVSFVIKSFSDPARPPSG